MSLIDLESFAAQIDEFLWPETDPKLRRKRERILDAATDQFVRMGYRKTSIDALAQHAGVAKGTVYLYYRNKAELAFHAVVLEKRGYLARMAPLRDTSASPREQLQSLVALGIAMIREMPLTASLMQGDREFDLALQEIDGQVLARINQRQLSIMSDLLDKATEHRWPRAVLKLRGQLLIDILFAVITWRPMNNYGMPWDEYANGLADVIVNGLMNPSLATSRASARRAAPMEID